MAPYFLDALRNEQAESDAWRWYANARDGQGAVMTYSFLNRVPNGTSTSHGDPNNSFETYTAAEKGVVRKALAQFEAVANIKFKETTGSADMQFGQFDINGNVAGYANYPVYDKFNKEIYRDTNFGKVWLDTKYVDPYVVLHEVGHGLGLEHPFEGADRLPTGEDISSNTVMSYTGNWGKTLEIYDIIALQSIYGPAKRRMGNDTYEFGKDKLIWDGGGKDMITAAKASKAVTIDLDDGSWNHVGPKAALFLNDQQGKQVYLGNFTMIENLTGSRFGDDLSGNELANRIAGRDGNDTIEGGLGRDWLQGGGGADDFVLTRLKDSTVAKSGRDFIDDFSHRQGDDIHLKSIDANVNVAGNQGFTFIGGRAFSGTAGELRFQDSGRNTLVTGDVDGDGDADFAILLRRDIRLVEADFIL